MLSSKLAMSVSEAYRSQNDKMLRETHVLVLGVHPRWVGMEGENQKEQTHRK